MLDPDEQTRRPVSTVKEQEGEYHFRSLDDILGRSDRDEADRVLQLAGRLARDVLASSIVFAEHRPLRITTSITSWTSGSIGSQTEAHFQWIGGVSALAAQPSLLDKRREHSRSIPALLAVPPPPSLITPSSSAHADLARNAQQVHVGDLADTGTDLATICGAGGGGDHPHEQVYSMTNGQWPRVRNGGVPVNESVASRQAVASGTAAQLPAERDVASTLSPHAEDSFSSELPKVNPRSVSLPNHQRTQQKEGLAPRKSSSFRGGREALKSAEDRRWSYASGEFAPATPSFVVDQRVALGARYASEKSLQVAEVSPTPFQLLQSQMNADEGSFPLPSSAAMQQNGEGNSVKIGHRAGRRPTTAAEHARAWKSSGRGGKKRNAFSRLFQRLFRHNRSSEHGPGRKPVGDWQSQDPEDSSGRISFPPSVRTHPGKVHSDSNSRRTHPRGGVKLSRISSASCPSIAVPSSELGAGSELSPSPSSTGHLEVEVPESRRHGTEPYEPSSVQPRRENSLRLSVRRGMNRIRGLSVRRRNKKRHGDESDGEHARGGRGAEAMHDGLAAADSASEAGVDQYEIVSIDSSASSQSLDGAGIVVTYGDTAGGGGGGGGAVPYHGGVYMGDGRLGGKSSYAQPSATGHGNRGGSESPSDPAPGDWRSLSAHSKARSNRSGSMPQVRINPPGENGQREPPPLQSVPATQVTARRLAPGKKALRPQRSKSVEGTTFDATKLLASFPSSAAAGRPKGIPMSPSCSASLERGYTLGGGDDFTYQDGAAQSGIRRTSSQRNADGNRLSIPGYQSAGPGMLLPPPSSESHSLSHSFSNLLNIVRRPSAQSSSISNEASRLSGSFLVLPGERKGQEPQYRSTESLTHPGGGGGMDVEIGGVGGGGRLLDTRRMENDICGSVPVSSLRPPHKTKHEMTNEDYRQHVVCTLLDMERSYLLSLKTLCRDYFNPLRRMNNIDQQIVADIFDDIPLITLHHNQLYYELKERADSWADQKTIGDIITNAFSFGQLAEAYSSYVVNYEHSQDTLRNTNCQPLVKFIKSRNKENEGKQTLSDLLVKPVQRIPRYGLIIKDLMNYTPNDHPDHGLLMSAFADVEALAEKLDRGVKHADQLDDLRKIELCFQGSLSGLVSPDRYLVRRDRISEQVAKSGHKERWLFLFNDRMACATMRRRTGNRKPMSMSISPGGTLTDPDVVRYKLMWRAPLQDVCVLQTPRDKMLETQSAEILQRLQDDLSTLSQMNSLCNGLSTSRPGSAAVSNLQLSIGIVLREINTVIDAQKHDRDVATLQIAIESKSSGLIDHTIAFLTVKEKTDWIAAFSECKETVVASLGGASAWCTPEETVDDTVQPVMRLPAFSAAMPVLKTRSGMQISCSSPSVGARQLTPYALDAKANGQLWICTSDGQVGQICMVSMEKSPPAVSACIAVPDGKITSILSVPEYVPPSVSDSLARIRRAEERDSSAVASDSEFETVSDAGTEGVADDDLPLKPNAGGSVSPRRVAERPEQRLSSEQLAFVRSKLSTALLLTYRNRLRLPSMVMEEKEESGSLFGERSRALSVLSNVSLKAFGNEELGTEELESIYSSASLLRVLSATPGLLADDGGVAEEDAVTAALAGDGGGVAPAKRLLVQSLSDGVLRLDPGALSAADAAAGADAPLHAPLHAPLARTTSHLHGLPEVADLLRHLQRAHSQSLSQGQGLGLSTPLQSQLSHASLLSVSSDLLEAPAKADGSNEWSQPEPAEEVERLLQRKSLSDDDDDDGDNEENVPVASGDGGRRKRPEGSTSDRDEPLEMPSTKPRHSVPISAKRLKPLVRRLSAPAESPTRLPLKSVKSPEDVFEVAGGKRLTNAVQNLLKPSRKGLRKPALRATKSGSASSTDVESSPVRYLGHASNPVQTQAPAAAAASATASAAASSTAAGISSSTAQTGREQQQQQTAVSAGMKTSVSSTSSDVCRSGSNVSRHSIDVVRRHKGSLQCRNHRSRKNRSQSLPQVILSSQTSVSGSTGGAAGSSSDSADGEASVDHDPTMWLSMSNGQLCIYRAGDSIEMRQRKTVLKLSSDVKCMCYLDGCVFVSLEGGQLLQFCRNLSGNWETSSADLIDVGEAQQVVSCMTVVLQQELWCGVGRSVHVVHPRHRQVQASFVVCKSTEATAQVTQMVCNDSGVYITTNTSPVVSVYHAHTHRLLAEVNIQPCVQYLLQGCDSIIKQHKTRCLRITVMHSYRSSVWIGTSAGIILAVPALHVAKETTDLAAVTNGNDDIVQLQCHGSFHGHTGPVRFITTVEMPATTGAGSQQAGASGMGSNSAASATAAAGGNAAANGSQGAADGAADAHGAAAQFAAPLPPALPPSSLMSLVSNSMRSSMFLVDQGSIMRAKKPPLPMVAAESYQPLADVRAVVVAGGDGCEDFHVSNMVENDENGFDNGGSHILMWQVD